MCVFFCVAICINIIMGIFLCNVCVFGWESCSVNGYSVKCVMWAVARVDTLAQHTGITEKGCPEVIIADKMAQVGRSPFALSSTQFC